MGCFSSIVLNIFRVHMKFRLFLIIIKEIHVSSGAMVARKCERMCWIYHTMFCIKGSLDSSKEGCIGLQCVPKSCIVHIRAWPLVSLISPLIKRVMVFDIKHIMIGKWFWRSVLRLNNAIWWVSEMINLIFHIACIIKPTHLSSC